VRDLDVGRLVSYDEQMAIMPNDSVLGLPTSLHAHPYQAVGFWSRPITAEHCLVYATEGRQGANQRLTIAACHYHY
jgi:Txe/YoeB family toxin of Txe-Axe toxin-antitoxin module